jgi:hypothetical protein
MPAQNNGEILSDVQEGKGCQYGQTTRSNLKAIVSVGIVLVLTFAGFMWRESSANRENVAAVATVVAADQKRQDEGIGALAISVKGAVDAVAGLSGIVTTNGGRLTALEIGRADNAAAISALKAQLTDIQVMARDTNMLMHQHMESGKQ